MNESRPVEIPVAPAIQAPVWMVTGGGPLDLCWFVLGVVRVVALGPEIS
jgi:hypothetical protein